ncbi:MAG: DMT family transporter [Chloroflexi bacterium]|nr:DMT family transporter [Chloroflexota bacterium]
MPPPTPDPKRAASASPSDKAVDLPLVSRHSEQERQNLKRWRQGLLWALLSPLFLGITPIFAKIAYATGVDVLTVVAFRTIFAAVLLWAAVLLFARHMIRSSTPAVLSSMLAGAINGIGSLFFYASLSRIDASLGQLINISYLIFVTILLRIIGQTISWLTLFRTALALFAMYLLTVGGLGKPDWIGVGMMLFGALTYAVQLVLSQRIMYEIPAPSMALYAMTAMAIVVTAAWLLFPSDLTAVSAASWQAILLMGLFTALARLTLFLGVKSLGSLQTALVGILEVIVSIVLAIAFLGEWLTAVQWLGAVVILISVLLVRYERDMPNFIDWWRLFWRFPTRKL